MAQPQGLPMHFLNAEQVLRAPLPNLRVGQRGIQTTTTAGNIKVSYTGNIAHWDTFEQEVWDFMTRLRAYQHLARCSHLPVCPSDTILLVNRKAMVKELIQAGAEITLSARFLERAIAPVVSSVETLTDSPHGQSARSMLPDDVRFGDSWIVDTSIRPKNTQPDIVGKLHGTHDARVIGELKFVVTVDLKRMVSAALGTAGDHRKLCNILGQVYQYMVSFGTRYAFLSNYESTIFLHIDWRGPNQEEVLYFSNVIPHKHKFGEISEPRSGRMMRTISVRSALAYLLHKTGAQGASWSYPSTEAMNSMSDNLSEDKKDCGSWQRPYSST